MSFLNIENIPLPEVPLRRALLVNQKGHKFGIFSIAYEENEDLNCGYSQSALLLAHAKNLCFA